MKQAVRRAFWRPALVAGAGILFTACASSSGGAPSVAEPATAVQPAVEPLGPPPLFHTTTQCDAERLAATAKRLAPGESQDVLYDYQLELTYDGAQLAQVSINDPRMSEALRSCIVQRFVASFHPGAKAPPSGVVTVRVRFVATVQG